MYNAVAYDTAMKTIVHMLTTPPVHRPVRSGGKRALIVAWGVSILALIGYAMLAPGKMHPVIEPVAPNVVGDRIEPMPNAILGAAINAHHISNLDLYLDGVDQIAKMGANALIVATPVWMENISATELRRLEARTPTAAQLTRILDRAENAHGLRTFLMPIVLLEEAGPREWRGVIQPSDWDAWWSNYRSMIDWYLDIANASGVDGFVIGSELNSTEDDVERWGSLIDHVRSRFDGHVTYSANWDRYRHVRIWRDLDSIAISSYFELVGDGEEPTPARLRTAWRDVRRDLLGFAEGYEKPLILSEVGYPSLPTAARRPWDYVNRDEVRADHAMQARCFEAFFEVWEAPILSESSRAFGFFLYHWDPYYRGGPRDTRYGWRGKPSHALLTERLHDLQRRSSVDRAGSMSGATSQDRPDVVDG